MDDRVLEVHQAAFTISTDRQRLDLDRVLHLLHQTAWGADLSRPVLVRAVANSLCFGVYQGQALIGFGRAITDLATYAYLTDVVIDAAYRGQGLGQWLVQYMLAHPDLQELRRVALVTRTAQALYTRLGFGTDTGGLTYMERRPGREDSS